MKKADKEELYKKLKGMTDEDIKAQLRNNPGFFIGHEISYVKDWLTKKLGEREAILKETKSETTEDPKRVARKKEFFPQLDKLGLYQVKARLKSKYWGSTPNIALANEWVELQEAPMKKKEREEELSLTREANEISKEANELSKKANKKADKANLWSIIATAISAIAAIAAIIALLNT